MTVGGGGIVAPMLGKGGGTGEGPFFSSYFVICGGGIALATMGGGGMAAPAIGKGGGIGKEDGGGGVGYFS